MLALEITKIETREDHWDKQGCALPVLALKRFKAKVLLTTSIKQTTQVQLLRILIPFDKIET